MISTLFNTDIVHVELSSKCTLKCPRCPRTELALPYLNQDISLELFKNTFTFHVLNHIDYLLFCGHTGDPIYNKDFLEIIDYITSTSNTKIRIITNGSYKSAAWWTKLGILLREDDGVTFSIDGWDQESNNHYRVNSDWESTMEGIRCLRSTGHCLINWSTIYFRFNQDHIAEIADLAKEKGCDNFQLVKSSKFDGHYANEFGIDPLKPIVRLVSKNNLYEREKQVFRREDPFPIRKVTQTHLWAKCLNGEKEINITVEGYVYPCVWFGAEYQKNKFIEKYKDKININTRPLVDILEDPLWTELVTGFTKHPLEICKIKCQHA